MPYQGRNANPIQPTPHHRATSRSIRFTRRRPSRARDARSADGVVAAPAVRSRGSLGSGVHLWRGCAADRRGIHGARSWREPSGHPLPVAASHVHARNHVRTPGSTVKIDAARAVQAAASRNSPPPVSATGPAMRPDVRNRVPPAMRGARSHAPRPDSRSPRRLRAPAETAVSNETATGEGSSPRHPTWPAGACVPRTIRTWRNRSRSA